MPRPRAKHRVCVSISEMESARLRRLAPDLESWQFVGPDDARAPGAWPEVLRGRGGRIVLGIDNLDIWVQNHFQPEVGLATVTDELRA